MVKAQVSGIKIKSVLKFFKLNENTISTMMGLVVVLVIAGMMFNYFRTNNLKVWQGSLLEDQKTYNTDNIGVQDKIDQGNSTYIVKKGDDLWHISEKFYGSGYNYVDLIKENKIGSDGIIYTGMELRIPKLVVVAKQSENTNKPLSIEQGKENAESVKVVVSEPKTIEVGEYTTKKGDTYWNIAVRAYGDGFQWPKIYQVNKSIFGNPDVINADVKIAIPKLEK